MLQVMSHISQDTWTCKGWDQASLSLSLSSLHVTVPLTYLGVTIDVMQVLAGRMRLEGTFDFAAVAAKTPGYVGADLAALTKEAGAHAITRVFSSLTATSLVRQLSTPLTSSCRRKNTLFLKFHSLQSSAYGHQVFLSVSGRLRIPVVQMQEPAQDGARNEDAADMAVDAAADAPKGLNELRMAAPEACMSQQTLKPPRH